MRNTIAKIFLTSFILFFSAFAGAQDNKPESDYVFAKKAFKDGFYDLAEERLEIFLKNYPQNPHLYEARSLLGRSYYYRNNMAGAAYEFEGILGSPQASQFHDEAVYWMGEIFLKTGDYKKAIEMYEKIISSFPASAYLGYALYSKGWAYYKLGLFEEALKLFRDVVERYQYEKIAVDSQFRIGECLYMLSRYADAGQELQIFIDRYPVSEKTADAYYMRGEAS
ncbi:MAG TPA: tetratricopeptide repeat protein, partial [Candidatus Omnitrophota bacterium]|nr:tetratricopeptide repeat protein [Candidatus Omnitrophota bacterium]